MIRCIQNVPCSTDRGQTISKRKWKVMLHRAVLRMKKMKTVAIQMIIRLKNPTAPESRSPIYANNIIKIISLPSLRTNHAALLIYRPASIDKSAIRGSCNVNCFKENPARCVASGCINWLAYTPLHSVAYCCTAVLKCTDLLLFTDKSP